MNLTAALVLIGLGLTGGAGLVVAVVLALRQRRGWRRWTALWASTIALVCVAGFLGPIACSLGLLDWMGPFEWPVGVTSNVLTTSDGEFQVVSLIPQGRIQLYTKSGLFLRGWSVEAGGGSFRTRVVGRSIEVYVARNSQCRTYSLAGALLDERPYDPGVVGRSSDRGGSWGYFRTPLWLIPLTHPLVAGCFGLIAVGIWAFLLREAHRGGSGAIEQARQFSHGEDLLWRLVPWCSLIASLVAGAVWSFGMTFLLMQWIRQGHVLRSLFVSPVWLLGLVLFIASCRATVVALTGSNMRSK